MSRTLRRITIGAVLLLVACSSTTFNSTWKAPGTAPVEPIGKTVAAIFISPDESQRRAGEDALAADLTQRGAIGLASYTIVPDGRVDGDVARQRLRDAGANGAVVMRIVGQDQQISYTPGRTVPVSSRRFGSYWGNSWHRVQEPGTLRTDTIVSVETLVYSLRTDDLLWASTSRTTNPRDLPALVREVASAAAREMANQGLLAAR